MPDVSGIVRGLDDFDLIGKSLTLRLVDGRTWDFIINSLVPRPDWSPAVSRGPIRKVEVSGEGC